MTELDKVLEGLIILKAHFPDGQIKIENDELLVGNFESEGGFNRVDYVKLDEELDWTYDSLFKIWRKILPLNKS